MHNSTKRKVFSFLGIFFVLALIITLVSQIDKVRQIFSRASNNTTVPLTGTYFYLEDIEGQEVKPILSEIRSLGMDTIITSSIKDKDVPEGSRGQTCNGGYRFVRSGEENFKKILDTAQEMGIQVYVGLIHSEGLCADWYDNPTLAREDATETENILSWINQNFPNHPAIAGWSIPNEAFLGYETNQSFLDGFNNYYKKQVGAIRKQSSLPIITAPSLLNYDISAGGPSTPTTVAKRAKDFIQKTGVDILVFQDSVGAGAVPLSSYLQPNSLKDFFEAIAKKIGGDHLWADIEVFTWSSGGFDTGGGYRPTTLTRIQSQVNDTNSASKKVIWIQQRFLGITDAWRLQTSNESERLFDTYRAAYQGIGKQLTPQNYTWLTKPDSKYQDTGNKLFDQLPGDPKLRSFNRWVGVNGITEILFSFPEKKSIWWVSFHVLYNKELSIGFPNTYALFCSPDDTSWSLLGLWSLPVAKINSEYVFSNPSKLNASCKSLKARFDNSWWTFISEVEITGP